MIRAKEERGLLSGMSPLDGSRGSRGGGGAPRGVIHRGRLREPREKDLVADHVGEGDGQVQEVLPEFLGDVGVEELRDIHASEEIPVFVENRRSGAERRGYVFV